MIVQGCSQALDSKTKFWLPSLCGINTMTSNKKWDILENTVSIHVLVLVE